MAIPKFSYQDRLAALQVLIINPFHVKGNPLTMVLMNHQFLGTEVFYLMFR